MTAAFQPSQTTIRRIGRGQDELLKSFLERDPVENLFMLSWAESFGTAPPSQSDLFEFLALEVEGVLSAIALVVAKRLVLLDSLDAEWSSHFGEDFVRRGVVLEHVVSSRRCVSPFWNAYTRGGLAARLDRNQTLYVLERDAFLSQDWGTTTEITLANSFDIDAVFLASARMHAEETLEDPLERDARHFRRHVEHRISSERTWVWFNERRRLLFKADISAQSSYGAQISGVYTPPALRGQGIATRALRDLCLALFERGYPRVTLYVNDENDSAIRVYEKIGFARHSAYETVFVATS
jgi:hypothetical protein